MSYLEVWHKGSHIVFLNGKKTGPEDEKELNLVLVEKKCSQLEQDLGETKILWKKGFLLITYSVNKIPTAEDVLKARTLSNQLLECAENARKISDVVRLFYHSLIHDAYIGKNASREKELVCVKAGELSDKIFNIAGILECMSQQLNRSTILAEKAIHELRCMEPSLITINDWMSVVSPSLIGI